MLHGRFLAAVEARDGAALQAALAPGVRFFSPVTFRPYEGRELVGTILAEGAMKVFEDFSYVHRLEDAEQRVATLVFRARVGGREMDGLDLLRFDGDGLVEELKVLVRPSSGLQALGAAMAERFAALGIGSQQT